MDSQNDSSNKRKLEEDEVAPVVEQQEVIKAMAEGTNIEEEAQEERPVKRVKVDDDAEVPAVGPQDPLADDAAAAGESSSAEEEPPICRYLPPSCLTYSNPDGQTGRMVPLKPHPIRWAIERRQQLESDSKAARDEAVAPAAIPEPAPGSNGEDGGDLEWTYYLREKDVGINEYLSAGLGQMQGIIKQR